MEELFITKIDIKNVRHLKDISIPLSTEERKHLILTGKNGSGKTSVLNAIRDFLILGIQNQYLAQIPKKQQAIAKFTAEEANFKKDLENPNHPQLLEIQAAYLKAQQAVQNFFQENAWYLNIQLLFTRADLLIPNFHNGSFLLVHFDAKRSPSFEKSQGINKVQLAAKYNVKEEIGKQLIKYLVYLRTEASLLRDEQKPEQSIQIEEWLSSFEQLLKKIFNDEGLKLEFDRSTANYTYNIIQTGREKADFNTLSDGYSAILSIVSELILRMQQASKPLRTYEMQGIVLIDEIETHLHLELQKQIFPFLTTVFPKIQFIVTTHSPFVISSVENAVVYDLETHICTDALYGSSYEAIAEAYFDVNKYSNEIQERLKEYETLIKKETRTPAEAAQMIALEQEFESLPKFRSPELFSTLRKLRNRPAANGQSH